MKYYLIVGEASGDLHASHLLAALKEEDSQAEFRFFGGDLMAAVGGGWCDGVVFDCGGVFGVESGFAAAALHLCQYEALQGGYCCVAAGCADFGGLSGL